MLNLKPPVMNIHIYSIINIREQCWQSDLLLNYSRNFPALKFCRRAVCD